MADLGGKGGMGESNEENLKGKPKSQARRSLKDILEAANSAWREDSGESKASSRKGESEIESEPRKGGTYPGIANPNGRSNGTMQPMHDKGTAVLIEGEVSAGVTAPKTTSNIPVNSQTKTLPQQAPDAPSSFLSRRNTWKRHNCNSLSKSKTSIGSKANARSKRKGADDVVELETSQLVDVAARAKRGRSIMMGCDLLRKGTGWVEGTEDCAVRNLIKEDVVEWDEALVGHLFDQNVFEIILSIPLSQRCPEDKRRWIFTKSEDYTVWLGYYVARVGATSCASCSSNQSNFWKQLWSLKVHNQIKNFLWCFCSNILPTKFNLAGKQCVPNAYCKIYGGREENQKHTFINCGWVEEVWGILGIDKGTNSKGWFNNVKNTLGMDGVSLCAYRLWSIWWLWLLTEQEGGFLAFFRLCRRRNRIMLVVVIIKGAREVV
ncbi:hypothetical protein Cgig2_029738 [Carnegiea gigantea]|uniref:Reverse transcriptase zinc-binding domain-containing protein n=1 Tax=Carnegiea gigantea TaxID=171969 RepID=A0A9Q1K0D1_9CARY|nr:hypothetical protein Cgig2_029738 [Carnegiea gigantea]